MSDLADDNGKADISEEEKRVEAFLKQGYNLRTAQAMALKDKKED